MSTVVAVQAAVEKIKQSEHKEIWIYMRSDDDLIAEAKDIDMRIAAGEYLPLAGTVCAVKDNIDVAGLPTTAACNSYSYLPEHNAHVITLLRQHGAIVIGKTNMDQFATGLVGTRSPFGVVRNSWDPNKISGGSSSGSAVAVALGLVDFALGTDTAGSGRVPAALNGIYGLKPTRGLVSTSGVVPACRSLDCVTVFARDLVMAQRAMQSMIGYDRHDPYSRSQPGCPTPLFTREASQNPGSIPVQDSSHIIAIPLAEQLEDLADGWQEAFNNYVQRVRLSGYHVQERDISPLLDAATLLYGPSFVAERYSAVGRFIEEHAHLIGSDIDATVAQIILGGKNATAAQLFEEQTRLQELISQGWHNLDGARALLTPTTTWHPTIEQIVDDPIAGNAKMGKYTNFCNLADCASIAVPAATVAGLPFGVMYTGPAFTDAQLAAIADSIPLEEILVFVVGAHRNGQVLNYELTRVNARYVQTINTTAHYRLFALSTVPPKPGLVYTGELDGNGNGGIEGELWSLTSTAFAQFVSGIPQPMVIGTVQLSDGRSVKGFLCEPYALSSAQDITEYRSWLRWVSNS